MPDYTTVTEVREILARDQAKLEGTAASLDDATIADSIVEATAAINARIAGRYTLPFTAVPALIQTIARDLAAWSCYLTFREVRAVPSELDPVYLRFKQAMEDLKALQNGSSVLPEIPQDPSGPEGRALGPLNESCDLFTECDFDIRRAGYRWSW